jgi:hypothetical protein
LEKVPSEGYFVGCGVWMIFSFTDGVGSQNMHVVLDRVSETLSELLNGVDSRSTQAPIEGGAGGRSIQRLVEELIQTCDRSATILDALLKRTRHAGTEKRTGLQWVLQLMILSCGYVPRGAVFSEDTVVKPLYSDPLSGHELANRLRAELETVDHLLDQCRAKFGMERVAAHPILGPLRVDQWRRMHVAQAAFCAKQLKTALKCYRHKSTASLAKDMHVPLQGSVR